MEYNQDKVDDMVLALMYLGTFGDRSARRAWKSFNWDALDRLHQKGYISNPKSTAKSVVVDDTGVERMESLFKLAVLQCHLDKAHARLVEIHSE